MKIPYLFGYMLGALWWLVVVCVQLSVPTMVWLAITEHPLFLLAGLALALIGILLTAVSGGLNTIPSILWRYRKNMQTRIVEVGGEYALQLKVFGLWIYVECSEGETGAVMTAWFPDLSAYPLLVSKRKDAEKYFVRLQEDIADCFKPTEHPPEVLATQVITRGNIVKAK